MSKPLEGLKVLDFSTLLPGPYASLMLADLGADVLRVESSQRPDLLRVTPPLHDKDSYAHLSINRCKRSLTLDLKTPEAIEIVHALLGEYDVVIEQFRPGVMKRLGLDYAALSATRPDLIYCSITGYGQHGPWSHKAGHDINYLALSGLASYSGDSKPTLSGTQIADVAGGSHQAVVAILAAVIARQHSGQGCELDVSMADGALAMNTLFGAAALATGVDPICGGTMLNGQGIYDYYQTADGRYLSVGSLEPQFVAGLCEILARPQWLVMLQQGALAEVKSQLQTLLLSEPLAHWVALFAQTDVCIEPVLSINEAVQHPHYQARNVTTEVTLADGQTVQQLRTDTAFSADASPVTPGARLGEHNEEVLQALGYDEARIHALKQRKIIG